MGHYRNRDHRYRPDLLPIVESHFRSDGLPENHGMKMRVSADGQSWYATRQTPSEWWFAIGAAGPPPDEWFYDGPHPPRGLSRRTRVGPLRRRLRINELRLSPRRYAAALIQCPLLTDTLR